MKNMFLSFVFRHRIRSTLYACTCSTAWIFIIRCGQHLYSFTDSRFDFQTIIRCHGRSVIFIIIISSAHFQPLSTSAMKKKMVDISNEFDFIDISVTNRCSSFSFYSPSYHSFLFNLFRRYRNPHKSIFIAMMDRPS